MLVCRVYQLDIHHLGRVITKDLVDYDDLFTLGEPSLWSEPCLCLRGRRWHVEKRGGTYSQRYQASVDVIERIDSCRVIRSLYQE